MRQLLIGIDSGTQSTKALVVDANSGKALGTGAQAYDLIPNLPAGAKEQHPHSWREATAGAIRLALRQAKAVAAEVVRSTRTARSFARPSCGAIRPRRPSARKSWPHTAG
jgi:sugar (pentulose or hexulose) kinase